MLAARSRRARSTRRGETSREQILQAAVDLLTERGYAGLSISGISWMQGWHQPAQKFTMTSFPR